MDSTGATDPYLESEDGPANPRRAVEGATLVIIAATVIAVVASSWPIFVTWIDAPRPDVAKPGIARALRGRGWAVAPPRESRPSIMEPASPRRPLSPHGGIPGFDPRDSVAPGTPSMAGAAAKPVTIVQLLDRADPDGRPVVSVNPNETLMVMREMGPWLLLAVKRNNKVEFGWTTRDQVSISR